MSDAILHLFTWIFLPINLFIMHPERIAIAAALFLLGYLVLLLSNRFRAWPLLVAAIAWGLSLIYSVRREKSAISSGCESRPANRSLGRKQPERWRR
jgi:hypothetical protein